jgi:hypothetical protein
MFRNFGAIIRGQWAGSVISTYLMMNTDYQCVHMKSIRIIGLPSAHAELWECQIKGILMCHILTWYVSGTIGWDVTLCLRVHVFPCVSESCRTEIYRGFRHLHCLELVLGTFTSHADPRMAKVKMRAGDSSRIFAHVKQLLGVTFR